MKIIGFYNEATGTQKIPVYEWHHEGAVGYLYPIRGLEEMGCPNNISDSRFDAVSTANITFFDAPIQPFPGGVLLYTDRPIYTSVMLLSNTLEEESNRLRSELSKERKNGRNPAEINRLARLVASLAGTEPSDIRTLYSVRMPDPINPGCFRKFGPYSKEQAEKFLSRWGISADAVNTFLEEIDA